MQLEGDADIVDLPEAMDLLKSLYRQVSGEHPDWDEYAEAMERDRRCIIRIPID